MRSTINSNLLLLDHSESICFINELCQRSAISQENGTALFWKHGILILIKGPLEFWIRQMEILLFLGIFCLLHFFVTESPVLSSFCLKECTSWDFGAIWGHFLEYFLDFFRRFFGCNFDLLRGKIWNNFIFSI